MCYEPQMQTPCLLSHKPSSMHAHYSADSEEHEALMLVQEEEHPSDQACDHTSSQRINQGVISCCESQTGDLCEWFKE